MDVVILCGGMGIRLRNIVSDRPKVMAEVNSRPFLDTLIDYVAGFKFRRFVLCVGYMKDFIKENYEHDSSGLDILFSEEKDLLGTAGAIKNAEAFIRSNPFLVMNGDSFCRIDMKKFLDFHFSKNAFISIALASQAKDADYGVVRLDSSQRVISFNEKIKPDIDNFVSAGIYLFNKDAFGLIPSNINYSLEYDFFPNIIDKGIFGYITGEGVIDIGTPDRYRDAKKKLGGN